MASDKSIKQKMANLNIVTKKGNEINEFIKDFANLRIEIFRNYPYLYEGNLKSEMEYLQKYFNCNESIAVFVQDKDKIVGVSTALPLQFEYEATTKPFKENDYKIEEVFYLSESVLLPEYRSNNIYPIFFSEREKAAREFGSKYTAFCCVDRPDNHPKKPNNYKDLSSAWINAGYKKEPDIRTEFSWKEIGESEQTTNKMQFWLKKLT